MKILVVNDDGPGEILEKLVDALRRRGHTAVAVVPERARSATGLARTYHKPLRLRCVRRDLCLVNGYPSDAVVLGLKLVAPDADLVLSGVNDGANLGFVSTYGSGTVGAALQAGAMGVRAVAVSAERDAVDVAIRVAVEAVEAASAWPRNALAISVNVPPRPKGVAAPTELSLNSHVERLDVLRGPDGGAVYWRWGIRMLDSCNACDSAMYAAGCITAVGIGVNGVVDAKAFARALAGKLGLGEC